MQQLIIRHPVYWCTVAEYTEEWGACPNGYLIADTREAIEQKIAELGKYGNPMEYTLFGDVWMGVIKEDVARRVKASEEKCIWIMLPETPFLQ